MGHGGLCLLTIWAVLPLWVMEMMAAAFIWRATWTDALLTASGTPMVFETLCSGRSQSSISLSALATMRFMVSTDRRG